MNRLLRIIFFALALLLAGYAVAVANYLQHSGDSAIHSKKVWITLAGAVILGIAGWRFSLKTKFKIFAVILSLFLVEMLLQMAALLGLLPGVNTKLKAPYARVYWTAEGRGNGIRNQDGWYYPPFDLKAAHKIAYVGDSQVEAMEVARTQNQAADLQRLLKQKSPDWSVLGLGNHGSCPAHSIDVLEYAWRHYQPQEAIVVVSMGTDALEASPKLNYVPVEQYPYYELSADGKFALNPASANARARFIDTLEASHRSLLFNLPVIINSHCMLLQVLDAVGDELKKRQLQNKLAGQIGGKGNPSVGHLGFNPEPFASNPSPDAQQALAVLIAQLQECKNVCDQHGMKFHLVTVPVFPKAFYDTQHGRDWTMHIGDYDYFGPERALANWARTNEIPVVAMGEYIQAKKMDVDEIRGLYFSSGMGHLTEKGHALIADAVKSSFYP